mgnify:CR=1 FL=1
MSRIVDTPRAFGAGSIVLHWTVAALTIALIVTGYLMLGMGRGPARAAMIARHTDIGWAVAMILVLRIGWRAVNPLPALSQLALTVALYPPFNWLFVRTEQRLLRIA